MREWYGPRRYWKWTRRTLIAAGVFFCALYVQCLPERLERGGAS